MNQDEEHLRLLAIFHYVLAGITAVFAMFPILHLIVGLIFIFAGTHLQSPGEQPPPAFIGWIFVIGASFFILLGVTFAILIFVNGRCIASRKRYTFCQVVAGVECVFLPLGTILGVFTLVVLSRETVRQTFGLAPRAQGGSLV